jgi:menaquinone-specific isochorismate synthase
VLLDGEEGSEIQAWGDGHTLTRDMAAAAPQRRATDWRKAVTAVLDAIARGEVEKVVLARQWERAAPADAWALLRRLGEQNPAGYAFAFETADGAMFLGCSPERLFLRNGRTLRTEALAGTRPVSPDAATDAAYALDLFSADKDGREHAVVVKGIAAQLEGVVDDLAWSPRRVRDAGGVRHVAQEAVGTLRDHVTDGAILDALHPTAAVCGWPRDPARALIRRHEAFDRGWYAGPFGVIGRDVSEVTVAIRSALHDGSTLRAFAGVGLVEGSDPRLELDELEMKVAPYLGAAP